MVPILYRKPHGTPERTGRLSLDSAKRGPKTHTRQGLALLRRKEWSEGNDSRDSSPFISEGKGVIRLHFNVCQVQSEMHKCAPDELALGYTQTMMDFRLFNNAPRHIGMVGLGGGSLQKYCYRHFPHAAISVAEISPEVIALRDRFSIPHDDQRFQVHCEDGADFVERLPAQFDVLLVDGFDNKGQPPQLCSQQFYDDCYRSLTPQGILVVNMYEGESVLIPRIRSSFGDEVVVADWAEGSNNTIVFAGKGNILATT